MTHYEKTVTLKPEKYGIFHYKNLACELCYSQTLVGMYSPKIQK
jgi:hypothetical protein